MRMLKAKFWAVKPTSDTGVIHIDYARKMVYITGRASSFLVFLEFKKNKTERWRDRTTTTDLPIYSRL